MWRPPRLALAALAVLAVAAPAGAQALQPPSGSETFPLTLAPDPQIKNGKIAAVEGVVLSDGTKLAVSDLSVLQPVEVTLFAPDEADNLRLELSKFILDEPAKTCSTGSQAFCTIRFRTQGDLQIKIVSPNGPRLYRLLVWAGNEVSPPMPPVFVRMDEHRAASWFSSPVLWVIAGLLAVIGTLLGVLVVKRGRR